MYTAVYAILGKEFAHDLIPVSYQDGMNQVTGFVGKPLYSRSNRTFQNFFINGRYVRSRQCSVALENAYQNLIMVGKFPTCVLMLQVPPEQVDVNIHPAKAEVRFSNEKAVMDSLFFAVKNALMQNGLIYEFQMEHVPQHDWTAQPEPQQEFVQPALPTIEKTTEPEPEVLLPPAEITPPEPVKETVSPLVSTMPATTLTIPQREAEPDVSDIADSPVQDEPLTPIPKEPVSIPELSEGKYEFLSGSAFAEKPKSLPEPMPAKPAPKEHTKIRVLGEIFENYIIAEGVGEDKLLIFDKHAAHERMNYEKLKSGTVINSQILISPVVVNLAKDEYGAVCENLDLYKKCGFEIEDFGNSSVIVRECPSILDGEDIKDLVCETAAKLLDGKTDITPEQMDWIFHSTSCRAAVKAGDYTSPYERELFVKKLLSMPNIRYCPHGRPVMIKMSKYDIEKQFGRA